MEQKKIPMRQCVGCSERKPKKELLRIVRTPEGNVVLDKVGKVSGRGAYICPSKNCLNKAKKSGKLHSHLEVEIPDEVYEKLADELD